MENKSWRQHPTKKQLYRYQPLITKTIKVRRTRHEGHFWRSKDELINDILLWTLSHGRAKGGQPARTYIQQICANTGCNLENLPGAMDDRVRWQERDREIRAAAADICIYSSSSSWICADSIDSLMFSLGIRPNHPLLPISIAGRDLRKNATSFFEQMLEATPLKIVVVRPLPSYIKKTST